jgi:cystathionine beta-lyase/cystathionine gamma-synthase
MFLEQHQGVAKVLYPGLPSHPQHELAKRQQHGFGAMITFYCIGERNQAAVVLKKVSAQMNVHK